MAPLIVISRATVNVHEEVLSRQNALTRSDRESYSHHRSRLTQTILETANELKGAAKTIVPAPFEQENREGALSLVGAFSMVGALCLLGAGNCNDVDLSQLLKRFTTICLVDIDEEAVAFARAGLSEKEQARVICCAPVDLLGGMTEGDFFSEIPHCPEKMAAQVADNILEKLTQRFSVVVSCCVMTQLGSSLADILDKSGGPKPGGTQFDICRHGVVLGHLRLVHALLLPGGVGLLVNDLASSEQVNVEGLEGDESIVVLAKQLIMYKQYRPSADPVRIRRLLRKDEVLAPNCGNIRTRDYWLWTVTSREKYVVQAISFEKWLE